MRLLKFATGDEGIFQTPDEGLFDKNLDDVAPTSRGDLIDQTFLTNLGLGDPTLEASPPAVNPSLTGPIRGAGRVDAPSDAASTTDTHDVFAAYDAGRFAALEKYAFARASGSHLPSTVPKTTLPKPPTAPVTTAATQTAAQQPNAGMGVRNAGTAQGVGEAQTHANAFSGDQAKQAPGATLAAPGASSAPLFKPTTMGAAPADATKGASLEVRSDYGKKEPSRYSIPADNGANYSPATNQGDKHPERQVSKAFNDLAVQRNADSLNEMGQASIGTMG